METNEKSRVLDMTQGDPFRLVLQQKESRSSLY